MEAKKEKRCENCGSPHQAHFPGPRVHPKCCTVCPWISAVLKAWLEEGRKKGGSAREGYAFFARWYWSIHDLDRGGNIDW